MDDVRVLVMADDPLARAGLAAMLSDHAACRVIGQVPADADPADPVAVYRPDVVLWDLGWDAADLPPALEALPFPIVALLPDDALAGEAWRAGVQGLLPREVGAEALVAALGAAAEGLAVLDPALSGAVLPSRETPADLLVDDLTPRELEVLQHLAEGLSNRAIGVELEISEHTVKFHVNAILGKLGAQSRTEAVVRATRLGLIIL